MKNTIRYATVLMSLTVLFVITAQSFAEPIKTAFVQPTATPTIIPPKLTAAPTATTDSTVSTTSFTQADLSLLTGNIQRPNGLVWHDGMIYAACSGDWTVYQIDAETGNTTQYIYGVKNAHSMVAQTDGKGTNLWIPDFQSNNLVEITQGVVKNVATNLDGPWGIAQFNDSQFLVTNLHGNDVVMVGDGDLKEIITNLRSPTGIVVADKYIYVANTGSARRAIEWFDAPNASTKSLPIDAEDKTVSHSLVTGLQNVTNIVMGSDGFLYFGYSLGTRGVVGRVDPAICRKNGGCSNDQIQIVVYSELAAPLAGVTLSDDMHLYIHSIFSPEIYWVDLKATPVGK
ncbi:MAG: hypothetical protein H0X30_30000 [Anaerolineae bacterium]|nr:hypothetical protein [Anaerolineae bacterium]